MRLLLTVTDVDEVATALGGGADLVDAKDPARGSLGPPSREVLAAVAGRLDGRAPLGVPLGDGPHAPGRLADRVETALEIGASYLKLGLLERPPGGGPAPGGGGPGPAGATEGAPGLDAAGAVATARRAVEAAEGGAVLMAVAFADAPDGAAPGPEAAVRTAASGGADGVMIDTLGKDAGSVVDRMGLGRLRRWCRAARAEGLATAVAGGLDAAAVRRLGGLDVDVVGVRGGACSGGRAGRLDPARCRALRRAVDRAVRTAPVRPPGGSPRRRPRRASGGAGGDVGR